jgi:hypothetical protein
MKQNLQSIASDQGSASGRPPVIVVSGLPRSGTSMMMKMLEAGGVLVMVDHLRTPDSDNPEGYYEFERVKKLDKGDTAWVADASGVTATATATTANAKINLFICFLFPGPLLDGGPKHMNGAAPPEALPQHG